MVYILDLLVIIVGCIYLLVVLAVIYRLDLSLLVKPVLVYFY